MNSFGENLKNERESLGYSQREMSKILKISQSTLSNWENNCTEPSIDQIITLLKILDITFEDLIS